MIKINDQTINILVIEDSETSALLITSIFEENKNINVIISKSVKKAVNLLKINKIKLILLDLMLPKIDGFSFLKMIKKNSLYSKIPIIVISALTKQEYVEKSLKLGAIKFIAKPLGQNHLKEEVLKELKIS